MLPNNKVDVYARINSEVSDFLDDARRAVDIDDSLVNAHFESVPGLGTLTARRLSGSDLEKLSGDTNRSSSLIALVLGSCNNFTTSALE